MQATGDIRTREPGRAESRRLDALAALLREEFGSPFRFAEIDEGTPDLPDRAGPDRAARARQPEVVDLGDGRLQLRLPFGGPPGAPVVAVGEIAALAGPGPGAEQERARVQKWAQRVHQGLRDVDSRPVVRRHGSRGRERLAWSALLGLEQLLQGHLNHRGGTRDIRKCLQVCAGLLGVETMIWAPSTGRGEAQFLGEPILSPWDVAQLALRIAHESEWKTSGYVLDNGVRAGWGAAFPRVATLLAVPIRDRASLGWLIALNKRGHEPSDRDQGPGPPEAAHFRSSDAAVLIPFASLLGLCSRSDQRHQGLKDLLVGLTRSLTSAIDAKDSYTYGHSERVARIAVVLGRGLDLRDEELSDIYLAGLLHDIGKIGIRDAVLGKNEPLTDEEFDHVKQHVTIGYRILSGLKSIDHLLPGVLYHHERYDGGGYPEGLKGDAIPFLARILAVADSFDAMSTSRPYRDALPNAEVEMILRAGSGVQWDERVVGALLRCRDEVNAIRQRGVGESLRGALDDAIRHGDRDAARSPVPVVLEI